MKLNERLKDVRVSKGLSVYKLSQLSDVSTTYIHEIEKGKKQPTVEVLSKLCQAMNVELADFFSSSNNSIEITIDDIFKDLQDLSQQELASLQNLIKTFKK